MEMNDRGMIPETPAEALAYVGHKSMRPTHPPAPGCCHFWEVDLANAEDLIDALAEIDWDPPRPRVSLPASVPAGDPRTAATVIENLTDRQWAVWWLLSFAGPLTDEELCERYGLSANALPKQTPQSIRTRRSELVRAGHAAPVLNSDGKQIRLPTRNGGTAGVWAAEVVS